MDFAIEDKKAVLEDLNTVYDMPELSRFFGIVIAMFYNDHEPAHFHAFYGEYAVRVNVETGNIMSGQMPIRARKLIEEWRVLCLEDLLKAWSDTQSHIRPGKISPLI